MVLNISYFEHFWNGKVVFLGKSSYLDKELAKVKKLYVAFV